MCRVGAQLDCGGDGEKDSKDYEAMLMRVWFCSLIQCVYSFL